jgi:protein-tyrosine phosphatase
MAAGTVSVLGGLAVVLLLGGIYVHWVYRDHRLTVVTPGRVFQSAEMPPQELAQVADRLNVQTVFDFRANVDPRVAAAERTALESRGVRYVNLPSSTSPAPGTVDSFVRAMRREVNEHRTVLLHCHDGEGRAVFYAAIYRMEFEGWDNQRAYQATTRLPSELKFLSRLFPSLTRFSPSNPKTRLILAYQPRHELVSNARLLDTGQPSGR